MANVKLFSEFQSDKGKHYKIEIYDNDYTGSSPDEFSVTSTGFQLTYSGETDNIYSPVIGSSCSFGMYIKDAATIAFLSALKQHQQDRYYIKILFGNSASPTDLFWAGYIVVDIVDVEDTAEPYILNIQATDGISKMANTVCTTVGFRKVNNQFINAIKATGFDGIYGASDPILAVVNNWFSALITYDADTNPLDTQYVDFDALSTIDEDGTITGKSWLDVLTEICRIYGMRFYYSDGQYRAEQIFERDGAFKEHTYQKDYSKITQATQNYVKAIDQTSNKARLAGNIFNFLPAVKVVQIDVNKQATSVEGVVHEYTSNSSVVGTTNFPTTNLGQIVATNNNALTLSFEYKSALLVVTPTSSAQFPKFAILKLNVIHFDPINNVTYYLKRTLDNNLDPSVITWETTQSGSGYEVAIGPNYSVSGAFPSSGTITISTPKIPDTGITTFQFEYVRITMPPTGTDSIHANNTLQVQLTTLNVRTKYGDIRNQTRTVTATNPSADIATNIIYDLGTTNIFGGLGERGTLTVRFAIGSNFYYLPSIGFREGNSGSYIDVEKLLCQEFAKLMDEPIEKYTGQIFSNHTFRRRLTFDSKSFLQMGGTFTANTDTWDGEWFAIVRASITPTLDDGNTDLPVLSTIGQGGSGFTGGVSFDGVNSSSLRTAAATVSGVMNNIGAIQTAINEVTGSAGDDDATVAIYNHMNYVTYSGGAGSYTIDLPTSVGNDGMQLRFATDNSVTASKTVVLTPVSGQTIDGASTYTLNRTFAGVTLMAVASNWIVIQEKNAT